MLRSHLCQRAATFVFMLKCGLTKDYSWSDKEEFHESFYWVQQLFSILCGVVIGVVGLTGILTFLSFCALSYAFQLYYVTGYQRIQHKFHDPVQNFLSGSWAANIGSFLMFWVISYTLSKR